MLWGRACAVELLLAASWREVLKKHTLGLWSARVPIPSLM